MQIVHVDRIFDRCPSDVVCFAIDLSPLDPTTRHPEAETIGMVVTTGILLGTTPVFRQRRPPEFSGTDHQCLVKHATHLEIRKQCGNGTVEYRQQPVFHFEKMIAVRVPVVAATAREMGLRVDLEATEHTVEGLVDALTNHFAGGKLSHK